MSTFLQQLSTVDRALRSKTAVDFIAGIHEICVDAAKDWAARELQLMPHEDEWPRRISEARGRKDAYLAIAHIIETAAGAQHGHLEVAPEMEHRDTGDEATPPPAPADAPRAANQKEINERVALEIMGYIAHVDPNRKSTVYESPDGYSSPLPPDLVGEWRLTGELIDHMDAGGWALLLGLYPGDLWGARFLNKEKTARGEFRIHEGWSANPKEAVCIAALDAAGLPSMR
ncbi:MAG: hypothetical protein LC754_10415 [Acidobacteria bacterium]|nr:hypothetical protein [Acidobacteriota bacterium]